MVQSVMYGGGEVHLSTVDYEKLEGMTYGEAQQYLSTRVRKISRWESFQNAVRFPVFWTEVGKSWLLYFIYSLVCVVVVRRFAKAKE